MTVLAVNYVSQLRSATLLLLTAVILLLVATGCMSSTDVAIHAYTVLLVETRGSKC
jgi:hypothetical protein